MLKTKTSRNSRAKSTDEPRSRDKYFSRAVSKALEVLEILQTDSNALSMNEIAQRLELSKTSAFRLLRTLELQVGGVEVGDGGAHVLVGLPDFQLHRLDELFIGGVRHVQRGFRLTVGGLVGEAGEQRETQGEVCVIVVDGVLVAIDHGGGAPGTAV